MAGISNLIGTPAVPLFGGEWVLSRFRFRDFAEAEREFVTDYLATCGAAADRLPPKAGDLLMHKATSLVASGYLCYGSPEFAIQASLDHRLPFLLWLGLKIKHPDLKREQAESLITPDNVDQVRAAVKEAMKFPNATAGNPPATQTANPSGSPLTPGEPSSSGSASPDSATNKSAT